MRIYGLGLILDELWHKITWFVTPAVCMKQIWKLMNRTGLEMSFRPYFYLMLCTSRQHQEILEFCHQHSTFFAWYTCFIYRVAIMKNKPFICSTAKKLFVNVQTSNILACRRFKPHTHTSAFTKHPVTWHEHSAEVYGGALCVCFIYRKEEEESVSLCESWGRGVERESLWIDTWCLWIGVLRVCTGSLERDRRAGGLV